MQVLAGAVQMVTFRVSAGLALQVPRQARYRLHLPPASFHRSQERPRSQSYRPYLPVATACCLQRSTWRTCRRRSAPWLSS